MPQQLSTGRASWTGILQLSLVAVPGKAYPAVSTTDTISFNQLHAECHQRIRYEKHCPLHGKIDAAQIVKGYQFAPDQYVEIEESELDKLRPPKEKALLLEQFVDPGEVEPARFSGRTLFLAPDGVAARRSYGVIVQAMQLRNRCAVGRVSMSGRRQAIVVRPVGKLLWLHVLHDPALIRGCSNLEASVPETDVSPQELELACQLIDAAERPVDWSEYHDDTTDKVTQLIEAKLAGREITVPEESVQVLQLMDALQQSVAESTPKPSRRSKSRTTRKRRTA